MKTHEMVYGLDEVGFAARQVLELMDHQLQVFTFTGNLGAGKTTLIQELLRQRGITDVIQSPTFIYVSIYTNVDGQRFYHFDLYRMKNMREFLAAGFDEYLYEPGSFAFIEWPEVIMPLLKKRVCHVAVEYMHEEKRRLRYSL